MSDEKTYQQTLDYLYSFVDYSLQRNFQITPEKFDLGRMRAFAAALGNPHQAYPVLHIAGTKGKGSVGSLCSSALQAHGYRVGLYTSPHLQDYTERIQVDGEPISEADLVALVEEIKPAIAATPEITTFEITTALGFLYFARQMVDVAVIEVGLGGRLDATNIVTPHVSVITSLSFDHTRLLGSTLAEIAGEKAGIIKEERPVVSSPQAEEARQVVARIAAERGSSLIQVGDDIRFAPHLHSLTSQSFYVWTKEQQPMADAFFSGAVPEATPASDALEWSPTLLTIPLLGLHQVENAATAYAALVALRAAGLPVDDTALQKGFASTRWPGRFELLRLDPPVIVDSAHNRDSAARLRQTLDDYFPDHRVVLIFGASEDKDIEGMFAELLPRVRTALFTRSYHPRAAEPETLVKLASEMGVSAIAISDVESALDAALQAAGPDDLILATGSIFLAAGVRHEWLQAHGGTLDALNSPHPTQ